MIPEKELARLYSYTVNRIQNYIKKHPGCAVSELVAISTPAFVERNVICTDCGHVEEKASYAIAQRAMGNEVIFTCKCGNKILL